MLAWEYAKKLLPRVSSCSSYFLLETMFEHEWGVLLLTPHKYTLTVLHYVYMLLVLIVNVSVIEVVQVSLQSNSSFLIHPKANFNLVHVHLIITSSHHLLAAPMPNVLLLVFGALRSGYYETSILWDTHTNKCGSCRLLDHCIVSYGI